MVVTSTIARYRASMPLSAEEKALWTSWKHASEAVMARVARDLTAETSLSGADFGVLSRLEDLGGGELRQQQLADSMGWDKARLSHHLTRMEARGLVIRRPAETKGSVVTLTAAGKRALRSARPVHARAVRRHLFARLTPGDRRRLRGICAALVEPG